MQLVDTTRSQTAQDQEIQSLWALLETIPDPEIPVISIRELGILRDVVRHNDRIEIIITPTYSGCPAMREIQQDITKLLIANKIQNAVVKTQLAPAWTTDWITEAGAKKLQDYGIAPPQAANKGKIACPQCRSENTTMISEFGSTACKSLYKCNDCLEPFDYFKCI